MAIIMNVIGICGKIGSGKSTVAKQLVDKHGYTEFSFSTALKRGICQIYSIDECFVFGSQEDKTTNIPYWNTTGRKLCEIIGTFFRTIDPDFWIKRLYLDISRCNTQKILISDIRYENELEFVTKTLNGKNIYVNNNTINKFSSDHESEKNYTKLSKFCDTIYNNSSIKDLHDEIDGWLKSH